MDLYLRLHVELLQLVEHLLQIQPVLGQDEDRPVHGHETDPRLALRLDVDVERGTWSDRVLAEANLHVVGIGCLDAEGKVVGGDLVVRQDLVHEDARRRGHKLGRNELYIRARRYVGE